MREGGSARREISVEIDVLHGNGELISGHKPYTRTFARVGIGSEHEDKTIPSLSAAVHTI